MHPRDQTIFALSSGRPPSALAVVRVSGPGASLVLTTLAGKLPAPRQASRRLIHDGVGQPIDDSVVLWFPGPASATGEDVAEFHVHGGRAVLAALFTTISVIPNIRAAEPGEFTRRAFENGKLDLTEAEGLDDLIHADTDRQRRQALRQLQGLLGNRARDWRERIIEASALIEAGIDFSDEGDVPAELIAPAVKAIGALHDEIAEVLAAQGQAERLRDGLVVAIAGEPNVGKSTLINQLARRDVAIVSPHAGTTRDVIEVQLDLDGYPVTVIDTAGIRETDDPVEQEGVRRARARAEDADLVLWLVEAGRAVDPAAIPLLGTSGNAGSRSGSVWIVRNKIDLSGVEDVGPGGAFGIAASRGDGIPELVDALVKFAAEFFGTIEGASVTRARQRDLLRRAADSLRRSLELVEEGEELAAEELRAAAYALGRLLGRVDVEDILGAIFQKFCVGK
ncbi:tRNA uridine-5-carboxymethylaminomethyl(34) synthesis GTPase MnmE [Bradyrhizobium sp. 4]|uniref:tRNA uridine-5-carboxymethylaminomethyl(34) synthesis GTPase MnmE n=1 Tax=unclassified Bradyrhizobium TaxID=2631580 RepID=UPI001FF8FD88|nr:MULTISPECIES: tRNA uridine-5-carboxymethylaminomethyl(34) synthesis GTPase MnmE [unclassified Bradyrhizobium]MCK1397746.1 tRNA uridine-5-carboxymethylaminomethyl(34) synthesis GTPase MnmE [Bradyrhizobium sp. 39]MCK1749682.1 tRNA uridine-5-carboxymethylaminomethyl(34) synthesis GTPase MnmE [Bradyrhizobium sp. 135]UPJ35429.1 tRNA uridine-5-carboxymethylaminomethyl(34) synthesis GTPase MnmE [Bradyrhizobium sp. 4]